MGYLEERRARALALYKKMGWGENESVKEADEELWKIITDIMFGEIWSRPGLSTRDREMVTLAALVMDKAEGMTLHMRHAHRLGITWNEMREVILQVMYYAGQAKGLFAIRCLKRVMAETGAKFAPVGKWPGAGPAPSAKPKGTTAKTRARTAKPAAKGAAARRK